MEAPTSQTPHTGLLAVLTVLFAGRVAGQAVQRFAPQPFLPDFHAFQGSTIAYGPLLAAQALILALMAWTTVRMHQGRLRPGHAATRAIGLGGRLYLALAIGRIAVGLLLAQAPPWFTTWIPAVFHVVLALFVVVLAHGLRSTGAHAS